MYSLYSHTVTGPYMLIIKGTRGKLGPLMNYLRHNKKEHRGEKVRYAIWRGDTLVSPTN